MDRSDRDDLESEIADHLNDLLAEVARRDEWLITSIWGVVRNLNYAVATAVVWLVVAFQDLTEWWQLILAGIVWFAWLYFQDRHLRSLEEDDKKKIGNDSLLGAFGSWWR
ncbi:MAG: hypothetical protein AAFO28_02595 [Pseudomonadota bacterium]